MNGSDHNPKVMPVAPGCCGRLLRSSVQESCTVVRGVDGQVRQSLLVSTGVVTCVTHTAEVEGRPEVDEQVRCVGPERPTPVGTRRDTPEDVTTMGFAVGARTRVGPGRIRIPPTRITGS